MNKTEIQIKNVIETIPSILIKKFELLEINNIQQISDINIEEFSKTKGIGKSVVNKLIDYQTFIDDNLTELFDIQESKTREYLLPLDYQNFDPHAFVDLLNESVTDYLNLINSDFLKGIINHYYGLNNCDKYNLDELSSYYSKTSERIRQLKEGGLFDLNSFFYNGLDANFRCICKEEINHNYKNLKSEILEQKILSKEIFKDILIENYGYNNGNPEIIELLIDLFSLSVCGKVETTFTSGEIIVIDKAERKNFIKTAEIVLKTLKKEVSPLNEMRVIINCKRKSKTLTNTHILKAIEVLPEIEMIQNGDTYFYQVKFEFLSRASDRAYRVLLENGDTMYIDNIVSEINRRLVRSNTSKIYDRHSLTLASDNRFNSQGKTGFWGLTIWGKNSVKIELLIKNALYKLDKPSTYDEICQEILLERPKLKKTSIRSLIGRDCLKVENDKWILPEWKQKYSSLAFARRKKREVTHEPDHRIEQRLKVIEYLKQQQGKTALASVIIKSLENLDSRYTKVSFYKLFEQIEYFEKSKRGDKIVVTLKQQNNSSIAIDEFNWQSIKEKLYRDLKDYFSDPNIAQTYAFDLSDSIALFNELVVYKTGIPELDGLDQRLLGNLNKFYFDSVNRVDKLNFLKQFLTCLDPLLKKILFLVDNTSYDHINSNRKGLGVVIEKLIKIDPTSERYKDLRSARKYRFGNHIQTSYYYRNSDTHSANDWTELEIANIISSCFVVYVFSCSEYYSEIKNQINAT
jgi:hypothetical protein